mgnify:CR=1 FL=1
MSDDNSQSSQGSSGRTWLGRITHMLQGEPQNREELVEVIADAQERDVIDHKWSLWKLIARLKSIYL